MIVDPILETGIAGGVGTGLTFQDNRSAIGHDQAGPYQKHTRLTERNLAIVNSYQAGALRDQEKSAGWRVPDIFSYLRRER